MRTRQLCKTAGWIALFMAAFLSVCLFTPAKLLFDEAFLTEELHRLGDYAPLFFVLLFTGSLTLGFPGNVLAVVGGAVFGLAWGTIWSLLGSTLGALCAFCLARYLLHNWVESHFGHHPILRRLHLAIANYPFTVVLSVRFTPLSPFSLVNFLFGLTPIDLKTYTLGTFFGLIPLTVTYSWLGVSGREALRGGDRISVFLALGVLAILSVLPVITRPPAFGFSKRR